MKTTVIESMARAGDADVESLITAWAKAGIFDEAGAKAIETSHAKGNAVTVIEDGVIYRLMPDGTRFEVRKVAKRSTRTYTESTIYIK